MRLADAQLVIPCPDHRNVVAVIEQRHRGIDTLSCRQTFDPPDYWRLRRHWRRASSLTDHFGINRQAIERGLSSLRHPGVPIYATPGRRGGDAPALQHTLPPPNLAVFCEVDAESNRELGTRVRVLDSGLQPVAALGMQPHWYLWASCQLRQAPRVFRLDRIRSATAHEETVRDRGLYPADVEMDELINRGILGDLNRQATGR
ncbi:MAG: WYL domain-containing protein [bacterium]|nr:WYL domain-containing protein [bacterium]MCP4959021.1 WYL domain-containing protein [Actinomycetes bacterium]